MNQKYYLIINQFNYKSIMKKVLFMALAAIGFASCSNEETMPVDNSSTKSVTVSIANIAQKTRSFEPSIANQDAAQLNTFTIFFVTDDGQFREGYALDDPKHEGEPVGRTFTIETDGNIPDIPTYHYIDPAVTKVIVVGNPTWDIEDKEAEPKNESTLKDITVSIDAQQDETNFLLIGEADLVKTGGEQTPATPPHTNVFKADVSITPLVSRPELGAFEYLATDGEWGYESLTVKHIALNNYYTTTKYDASVDGFTTEELTPSTVWPWIEGLKAATAWHNDAVTNVELQGADDLNKWIYTDQEGEIKNLYAYDVLPGATPQIVVTLVGTKADGTEANLYLMTSKLKDGSNNDVTLQAWLHL